MLTGNEPVSTGNLRASLGSFAHHRAGAFYEIQRAPGQSMPSVDSESIDGDIGGRAEYYRIALPASTKHAAGCRLENGLFVPDRPGLFEVSVVAKNLKLGCNYNNSDDKAWLVASVGGEDVEMHKIESFGSMAINATAQLAVPADGVQIGFRFYFKYSSKKNLYVTMQEPKVSIIEI